METGSEVKPKTANNFMSPAPENTENHEGKRQDQSKSKAQKSRARFPGNLEL